MAHFKLVKAFTLLSFTFFIALFVAYRTGRLNSYLSDDSNTIQTSHNGGPIKTPQKNKQDSIKRDSIKKLMLSSSKVIILTDKNKYLFDTTKRSKQIRRQAQDKYLMYSSKSGIVFTPNSPKAHFPDTLKIDSGWIKKKKQ